MFCDLVVNKYGLHDTYIDRISCFEKTVVLSFEQGVYILDDNHREVDKTPACTMRVEVGNQIQDNLVDFVEVYKCRHGRYKEISIVELSKLLIKNKFDLSMDYYSEFSKSLLLIGYIGKYMICLTISDIKRMQLEFV